jgi:hypothetical protein
MVKTHYKKLPHGLLREKLQRICDAVKRIIRRINVIPVLQDIIETTPQVVKMETSC